MCFRVKHLKIKLLLLNVNSWYFTFEWLRWRFQNLLTFFKERSLVKLLAWPSPPNKVFFLPPHRPRQGEADWGEKKSQDSCSISFKAIRDSTKATYFIRQEVWHFVGSQTLGGCQTSEVWVQNQWCGWSTLWASRRRGDTASKKQKGPEATFEGPCQPLGERYRRFEHFEAGSGPQGATEIPKGLLTITCFADFMFAYQFCEELREGALSVLRLDLAELCGRLHRLLEPPRRLGARQRRPAGAPHLVSETKCIRTCFRV